ncbi:MAG: hypothetical protein Q3979_01345 [Actinomycetaceae bacterium]|nr:hypothetical protein [Actinomycetaceae bacterium]
MGANRHSGPANPSIDGTASERGDVPGWVLVTLMTAGLVIAIWAVAGPALVSLFNTAIERIRNF